MMKTILFTLSLIALSLSCQNQSQSQEDASSSSEAAVQNAPELVNEIVSTDRFKVLMDETTDFQLIDVRTPEEYNAGYIEGALNLDFRAADFDTQLQQLDKSKPVLVYCQSGGRSGQAAAKMKVMAFRKVYDLEGGYGAWVADEK